jgi:hypothetical protein
MLVLSITKDKEGILLKNLDNNSTCMINIADKSKIKYEIGRASCRERV